MASERDTPSPSEQVARLYEQMEVQAAQAGERLVGSGGFASLLGQLAENTAAMTKLTADGMDLVLRNLRVAGRRDVIRLARQLARTEDKLERVLQEVEGLRAELARASSNGQTDGRGRQANGSGAATGAAAGRQGKGDDS
jgi:hypothetical protein